MGFPSFPPGLLANLLACHPIPIAVQASPIARISHSNRSRTGSPGCRAIGIICLSAVTNQRRPRSCSRLTPRSRSCPVTVVVTGLAVVVAAACFKSTWVGSCRRHWPRQKYDCREDESSHGMPQMVLRSLLYRRFLSISPVKIARKQHR